VRHTAPYGDVRPNAQEILERGKISRALAVHAPCREGECAENMIGELAGSSGGSNGGANSPFMSPTL
jgi:hypothetical protein